MTYEESKDMSFHFYELESLIKWFVSKGYLDKSINKLRQDLEKSMHNLKGYLAKNREGTMKTMDLINLEEMIEEKVG